MQAIILAAGRGRRMEPLSRACHKALLEIGGVTILGRALDSLVAAGVSPITVVTGYRAEDITRFIGDGYSDIDVRFVSNERYNITNNIVSLALALDELNYDEDVILIECDLLFEPRLIKELVSNPAKNIALVDNYRTGMDGTVVAIENGYVTQVFPAASQDADFRYEGKFKTLNIYRFDRIFCQRVLRPMVSTYAAQVDPNCYYELVLGMLANIPEHRISAQVVAESDWVEVDDPNDLSVAKFRFDSAGRSSLLDKTRGGHWSFDVLDFSSPTNAYYPPPGMYAALRHGLPDVITGYGSAQAILDEKAALFLDCDAAHVRLLNGASQAYPALRHLYQGCRAAIPAPTLAEYRRVFPDAVNYPDSPGVATSTLSTLAAHTDVVVVVNPNTPTGTTLATNDVFDLAMSNPGTVFLVDESFLPFSGQPSLVGLLESRRLPNVVVLASLSGLLGVPGLRLGYLYSVDGGLLERFSDFTPAWGVNALAEYFLELTLKFRSQLASSVEATMTERARMRELLADQPVVERVYPSGANFLLVDLRGDNPDYAAAVRVGMLEAGIELSDVSGQFAEQSPRLRIAIRSQADNDRFLKALRRVHALMLP